jgi:hypothetical protein
MATFPSLVPIGRTFTPGIYPHTPHPVYNGRQVRVRHSNAVVGGQLRLSFGLLTRAEKLDVKQHYADQLGGFLPFEIPAELLLDVADTSTVDLAGYAWRYIESPRVVDVAIDGTTALNLHNIEIALECVPPETTIAGGARWRVRTTWAPGRASVPLFWPAVAISWAPGDAYAEAPGAAWTVTTSWTPGAGPVPGAAWSVGVLWDGGDAYDANATSDALWLPAVWDFEPALFLFPPGS